LFTPMSLSSNLGMMEGESLPHQEHLFIVDLTHQPC